VRFKYGIDEPDANAPLNWPVAIDRLKWIKNNPGVGKGLKVGTANRMEPAWQVSGGAWVTPDPVGNGMDIFIEAAESAKWTGYHTNKYSAPPVQGMTVEDVRAKGKMIGSYNGYRPDYGLMPALDAPATEHRAPLWVFYKYHTDLYLLWETAYWATHPGLDTVTRVGAPNPWQDPYAQGAGWVYSGEDTYFTGDNRGLKGPIASIRMKTFRRGLQDYEYLWMAQNVKKVDVTAVVNDIVPAAYDDNITDPRYNTLDASKMYPVWAEDNYRFEAKRKQLALILSDGVIPPDPVSVPPTVVTQPVSATVVLGTPITLVVTATGTLPLTYQWMKTVGGTVDYGVIAGATGASHTFTPALADTGASYVCVVSNALGKQQSGAATVLVTEVPVSSVLPTVVTQPVSVTSAIGRPVTLFVAATGTLPLTYQWRKKVGATFDVVVDATGASYTFTPTLADNGASYACVVSNAAGTQWSNAATLTVQDGPPVIVPPPVITVQPKAVTVTEGQPAMFDVTATGEEPLTYQWKRGGLPIVGALASHLIITPTFLTDNGASIECTVVNPGGGTISAVALLTVLPTASEDYKRGHADGQTAGRIDGYTAGETVGRMIGVADLQQLLPLVRELNVRIGWLPSSPLAVSVALQGTLIEKTINDMIQETL
jgi:hypothetical protein